MRAGTECEAARGRYVRWPVEAFHANAVVCEVIECLYIIYLQQVQQIQTGWPSHPSLAPQVAASEPSPRS